MIFQAKTQANFLSIELGPRGRIRSSSSGVETEIGRAEKAEVESWAISSRRSSPSPPSPPSSFRCEFLFRQCHSRRSLTRIFTNRPPQNLPATSNKSHHFKFIVKLSMNILFLFCESQVWLGCLDCFGVWTPTCCNFVWFLSIAPLTASTSPTCDWLVAHTSYPTLF